MNPRPRAPKRKWMMSPHGRARQKVKGDSLENHNSHSTPALGLVLWSLRITFKPGIRKVWKTMKTSNRRDPWTWMERETIDPLSLQKPRGNNAPDSFLPTNGAPTGISE